MNTNITEYNYVIYVYTGNEYGTTGVSFTDKDKTIKHASKMINDTGMEYGIFVEYSDNGLYHRRLVWKNGKIIIRKYKKKISFSAELLLNYITTYIKQHKKVPTFNNIKEEMQKRDYDVHRMIKILHDANLIVISKPFNKENPFTIR